MTLRDDLGGTFLKNHPTETRNRGVATQPCVQRVSPGPAGPVSRPRTRPQAPALHVRLITARNASLRNGPSHPECRASNISFPALPVRLYTFTIDHKDYPEGVVRPEKLS